ncbi:stage II sporulation protein D [Desmospora profundinema]|uniref:Stage II sporulation protein D n=1 Tax=Desmospora profundinema TaxID=1571184 RepID=A0ABU1IP46_9BACL|nr:stage II sporulation protein D [Desmospora profundinema]MDR6225535.1 stage II sporulation protein D [Desmospora profundinema]
MHKGILLFVSVLVGLMIILPAALVSMGGGADGGKGSDQPGQPLLSEGPDVKVYLTEEKKVVDVPLEAYIRGVVAAEMPAEFHTEALKAQALAARTYIVDRLERGNFSDMKTWGETAASAHVSDTVQHQVYETDEQLQEKWKEQFEPFSKKVDEAVRSTQGQVILFEGEPIYAAFFSTSNGHTENAEDYFEKSYPYLKSVDSSWDLQSPKFADEKKVSVSAFLEKLKEKTGKEVAISASSGNGWMEVKNRTQGERVATVQIGDQEFTGREVREALDLASSDFEWSLEGDAIIFRTKGYGHGVGMSQWGANLMAEEGKEAEEIIRHYYQGVEIDSVTEKEGE